MLNAYPINEYISQFITKAGSKYSVSFEDGTELIGIPDPKTCRVMHITLKKEGEIKDGGDSKISDTIVSIILDHLQRFHDDIVCYICSTKDGQVFARRRLFLKWFYHYNAGDFVCDSQFLGNEEHFFIYHITNNSAKQFLTSLPYKLKK